jgi:uncharacterized membrane protein
MFYLLKKIAMIRKLSLQRKIFWVSFYNIVSTALSALILLATILATSDTAISQFFIANWMSPTAAMIAASFIALACKKRLVRHNIPLEPKPEPIPEVTTDSTPI